MKKLLFILLISSALFGCNSVEQKAQVVEQAESNTEWTAPSDFRKDSDVWKGTDKPVRIRGCEDWKKKDPEADC